MIIKIIRKMERNTQNWKSNPVEHTTTPCHIDAVSISTLKFVFRTRNVRAAHFITSISNKA